MYLLEVEQEQLQGQLVQVIQQLQLVGQQMATMVFTLMVLGMDFHIKQAWMIVVVY